MGFNVGGGFAAIIRKGAVDTATRANNKINALNASTGNSIRQGTNAAAAAQGNLARFTQSVNNNKILTAGGNAQAALTVNALRGSDAHMAQDFSGSIAQAEQAGHMAASAASAGVDGNVVDMVDTSTALRNSIIGQQVKTSEGEQAYDVGQKRGQVASQMISSMDSSIILDHLNYNIDTAKTQGLTNTFSAALQGFFPNGTDSGLADALQSAKTTIGNSALYNSAVDATGPSDDQLQSDRETARFQFLSDSGGGGGDASSGYVTNPYSIDDGTPFNTTGGDTSNLYGLWSG
jgi:hypothetical protein